MNKPPQHGTWIFGINGGVVGAALALAMVFVPAVVASRSAQAQNYIYSQLFSFDAQDGYKPFAGLVQDAQGNLYGTTSSGGANLYLCHNGCGTVFKLDTTGKETVLYSFTGGGDGRTPLSDLVLDAQGNLYGTTYYGGNLTCPGTNGIGCGTVFKLDTTGKETVLHSFSGSPDGSRPKAGLVLDAQGNLYGTTYYGGSPTCDAGTGCGTVFKVDTTGNEAVLFSFTGNGRNPGGALVLDANGNLYGTTVNGGRYGRGVVFKIDPTVKQTVLYSFTGGADGAKPLAVLVQDAQANLYGTTSMGGNLSACLNGCGTVFKLDPTGNETVLYSFTGTNGDGKHPEAGLVLDGQGNLYGTTRYGGITSMPGPGTVFKVDTTGKETVLYKFGSIPKDGNQPAARLLLDAQGNLHGTTVRGGRFGPNSGTVFKLAP
jgi:uncharacterized repeat protein (TIGR03803 family)